MANILEVVENTASYPERRWFTSGQIGPVAGIRERFVLIEMSI
jgi:hypothetical protein